MKKFCLFITALVLFTSYTNINRAYYKGIDVSHHNKFNWEKLPEDIHFCYIKATEGVSYIDSKIEYNTKQASKKDMCIGYYHYYRTNVSGKKQFIHFRNILNKYHYSLYPVLDIEDKNNDFSNLKFQKRNIQEFLDCFYKYYGYYPIIYYGNVFENARETFSITNKCNKWDRTIGFFSFIENPVITQYKYITIDNTKIDCNKCYNINKIIIK